MRPAQGASDEPDRPVGRRKETVTVPPLAEAGVAALGLVLVLAGKKK
jgi:hypothetical protein